MKIVVCVRHVPENTNIDVDPNHGRPAWSSVTGIMNPFDAYAVEQGVLLKEKHEGEVICLTLGPAEAEATLRAALASGADRGILISGSEFENSDAVVTASTLSKAVEKIGDVDLVICGKQAIGGDTAQVGPLVGGMLGWPQAIYVSGVRESTPETLVIHRMQEDGYDVCEIDLPAVMTVVKDINSPRIPSLRSRMAANKAELTQWGAVDIELDSGEVGVAGSPSLVIEARSPAAKFRHAIEIQGDAEECAEGLVTELKNLANRQV